MKRIYLALLTGVGLCLGVHVAPAFAYTQVYVDTSINNDDPVGQDVANDIIQDIGNSSWAQEANSASAADYVVEFVSIPNDTDDNGNETSAAYSITVIDSNSKYVMSRVGVCGSSKENSCADSDWNSISKSIQ